MARRTLLTVLVFAAAMPLAAIALWSLGQYARDLTDPCTTWEAQPRHTGYVRPSDPCRNAKVVGQSKASGVALAVLGPGGILTAAILAVMGAARRRPRLLLAGGFVMLAETLVALSIFPLTAAAGTIFLLVGASREQFA